MATLPSFLARRAAAFPVGGFLLLMAAGCGGAPSDPAASGADDATAVEAALQTEVTLEPGQTAVFDGGLRVTFEEVVGDSRCPLDVTCLWAGDATVAFSLAMGEGDRARTELHTHPDFRRSAELGGYTVRLVDLTPHPRTDRPPEEETPRAVIEVTR